MLWKVFKHISWKPMGMEIWMQSVFTFVFTLRWFHGPRLYIFHSFRWKYLNLREETSELDYIHTYLFDSKKIILPNSLKVTYSENGIGNSLTQFISRSAHREIRTPLFTSFFSIYFFSFFPDKYHSLIAKYTPKMPI